MEQVHILINQTVGCPVQVTLLFYGQYVYTNWLTVHRCDCGFQLFLPHWKQQRWQV